MIILHVLVVVGITCTIKWWLLSKTTSKTSPCKWQTIRLVGWGLTALLTQNRSYRACRFVGIFYSKWQTILEMALILLTSIKNSLMFRKRRNKHQQFRSCQCTTIIRVMYACMHWIQVIEQSQQTYEVTDDMDVHIITVLWNCIEQQERLENRCPLKTNAGYFSLTDFSALTQLGGRKGIRPVKMGGWWRWALVSPDGVIAVSASINLSLHHKVQKFSSGTGSPGWSWKKGP